MLTRYIYTWGTLKHLTYTCTMISVPLALKLCNFKLIGLCQNKVKVGGKKNLLKAAYGLRGWIRLPHKPAVVGTLSLLSLSHTSRAIQLWKSLSK